MPPTVTVQGYSLDIFNTSNPDRGQHLLLDRVSDVGPPGSNGRYSYIFVFDKEPTQCMQITFSVTSLSSVGTSSPSNATWEKIMTDEG